MLATMKTIKVSVLLLFKYFFFYLALTSHAMAHFNSAKKQPGVWIHPPKTPDQSLKFLNSNNKVKTFSDIFHKKWSLVYIGYTHCKSTCPSDLIYVRNLYQALNYSSVEAPFYFLTADPKNDTPAHLKNYLKAFNKAFTGLVTLHNKTVEIMDFFESPLRILKENDSELLHSSHLYLIGPYGQWWKSYTFPFVQEEIILDIKKLSE